MQIKQTEAQETHDEPPAKKRRGRPRTSHENVTTETKPKPKPATRAKKQKEVAEATDEAPAPKKRGRPPGSSRVSQSQDPEPKTQTAVTVEEMEADDRTQDQENEDPQRAQKTNATKPAGTRRRRAVASVRKELHTDNGFDYTPRDSRKASIPEDSQEQPSPSPHPRAKGRRAEPEVEETQEADEPAAELVDETILPDEPASNRYITSPVKNARARASLLRHPPDTSPRKRKLGETEQSGDPELRRRLGELNKKHDALEVKYRNLREIGIVEANANMDKLRKQCETVTTGMFNSPVAVKADRLTYD
jgi:hypothetical protein